MSQNNLFNFDKPPEINGEHFIESLKMFQELQKIKRDMELQYILLATINADIVVRDEDVH